MKLDITEEKTKQLLKEVLVELLETKKELFSEIFAEVLEDFGLANAIIQGRKNDFIPEEEILLFLEQKYAF